MREFLTGAIANNEADHNRPDARRMFVIRRILITYLVITVFFCWGFAVAQYRVFPASQIAGLAGVIKSGLPFIGKRNGNDVDENEISEVDSTEFQRVRLVKQPDREYQKMSIDKLAGAATRPMYFKSTDALADGNFLMYGAFGLDTGMYGALLLDRDFNVSHVWTNTGQGVGQAHGFEILPDGSMVAIDHNFGNGIMKTDVCGNPLWSVSGRFNDVIQLDHTDGDVWTISQDSIVKLSIDSGEIVREISLADIHQANPDIAVFTPRRSLRTSKWYHNPIGLVDVEPLSALLAEQFPQFNAGDLLLSYQSLNLIVVIDPESLQIKWWRTGVTLRQHDVDWAADGTISIYDNNRHENKAYSDKTMFHGSDRFSRIVKIDPKSMDLEVMFEGKEANFYSGASGKHQIVDNNHILLSSPEQGRAMEIDAEGDIVIDLVNQFNDDSALIISEFRKLPVNYFDMDIENTDCP